jgi:hypothetical protein
MDHATRNNMEGAFGADFGGVRIHTDARADDLNRALSAKAFTTGQDVFFRSGEYNPGSSSGRELLAHELTHVVQQDGAGVRAKMSVSQPGDPHELEADSMARAVLQREQQGAGDTEECSCLSRQAIETLQRQPEGEEDNGETDGPQYPPDWQHGAPTKPVAPDPHVAPDPNQQPVPPDQGPYRSAELRSKLVTALGIVLGLAVFVALVACFATGVCEAAAIVAVAGAGAFLVVAGILRSMGIGVSGDPSSDGGGA